MANDTNRQGQRIMTGDKVTDIITGFRGTIMTKTEELGGQFLFGLQGQYNENVGRCPTLIVSDVNQLTFEGKSDYVRNQEGQGRNQEQNTQQQSKTI